MKKINLLKLSFISIVVLFGCNKTDPTTANQTPHTIQSFSPLKDTIGGQLIINGTNFSTTSSNNIVKINGIQATVISATDTKLIVIVPNSVNGNFPITVTISNLTVSSTTNLRIVSSNELLILGKWKYAKSLKVDSAFLYNGPQLVELPWPFITPPNNISYNLDTTTNYLFFSENGTANYFQFAWGLGQSGIMYKDTIPYTVNNSQVYLTYPAGTNQIATNPQFSYPTYTDTIKIQSISINKMVIYRNYHDKHYGHANTFDHRKYSIDSLVR